MLTKKLSEVKIVGSRPLVLWLLERQRRYISFPSVGSEIRVRLPQRWVREL